MVHIDFSDALYTEDDYDKIIIFTLDQSKGLVNAIAKVFLSSPYACCLQHLHVNFLKTNGWLGKVLKDECWSLIAKVVYTYTTTKCKDAVDDLLLMSMHMHC